ncbi:Beta-galactosidase [Quillaja saponaria]|uniref:beta-galactosidase n=1 Tax=Quillaja saponaria TaxID=32244 RepID=A0AAD7P8S8_QUISA|nr:Beta-galactosidase [Quillaja saponaria]
MAISKAFLFVCFLIIIFVFGVNGLKVAHDGRAITIDGERRILLSGSIHYPRSTTKMWPDLIRKSKEGGLDAIETYVFWNAHEPVRRQYDFTGNLDLIRFLKTIQEEGLYAVLRIGPYVCAEWNYGGLPVWLHNMPGCEIRTANDVYMNEMKNFTTLIIDMVKKEKLFASQGGNIILAQIENEYGNVMSVYGDAGKAYIDWCANMAESFHIGVPWIMCQQSDAPQPMINTCNGWYCDSFTPNNPNSPKMWTENWTGWFKNWGSRDPHRTAEDVAFSVARFFQYGGTFQNYYMYHGGTNFGRSAGGPYITTSYDYDAPLDEYGNLNQPKWGHLKQLHQVLKSIERTLTHGNITTTDFGNSVTATIYATNETSSCFLGNANTTTDATITFQGTQYSIPAWSVSILPDCKNEAYNTAKVNTQTSHVAANTLLDQKNAASDVSDYLWYMTSVNLKADDPIWSDNMTLRINGSGHILHAYVNGEYVASQWATYGIFNYVFEHRVKLKPGKNLISILSATVGYQNYGSTYKYDMIRSGILGPVELIGSKGDETVIKDLSSHKWSYKIGLHGFENELFSSDSKFDSKWESQQLPINRMMTWYKTTFKAPLGTDAVVVDLLGLGKGMAWVNGQSLGRYWPSYKADEDGCSAEPCDYRGTYNDKKCVTNCGEPTQRWYHVPRSFLQDGINALTLFEEFGGNPSLVNFQTITVGTTCGNGTCESPKNALSIIQNLCVGKEKCSIDVSEDTFGLTSCGDISKRLAVEAIC